MLSAILADMTTTAAPAAEARCERCTLAAPHVHCLRCDRPLRSAAGRTARYGSGCLARIRREAREHALDGLTDKQREEALEIAADGGAVQVREGVWQVTSGDGSQVYLSTPDGHCNCRWGQRRTSALTKVCKHVGAVRLVAITPRRSRRSLAKAA